MKKKERGKPTKTSTERRKKSGEGREKKWSKGGQKLRLWVPPCVFIYENAIEL